MNATPPIAAGDRDTRGRRVVWWLLMVLAAPPAFVGAALVWIKLAGHLAVSALVALASVVGLLCFFIGNRGIARRWHAGGGLAAGGVTVGVLAATVAALFIPEYNRIRESSLKRTMLSNLRPLAAAEEIHFYHHEHRVFYNYEDLVGPNRSIKATQPAAGEDYRTLFPRRLGSRWEITTPGGVNAYYHPPDFDPETPPDGVHVIRFSDGRRFETTWKNGEQHGPFRAYYADGTLWCEAQIEHGRAVGPSWLYTRDGRKFDELADGDKAVAEIEAAKSR